MELKTVYFEKPGKDNTEETLQIAKQRAEQLGIRNIVVASTIGTTAVRATEVLSNCSYRVIAVTHVTGFREPDQQEFTDEHKKIVESNGGIVLTAAHSLGGLSRALRQKHSMYTLGEIVADTFRIFGQGMKVVCEIAATAADAGLVRSDEDAISIGGTGRGADTAVVLRPVDTHHFFNLRVREILCKPHF